MSIRLSQREQVLGGLFLAVLLLYLFLIGVHQPITRARAEARERWEAASASLAQSQARLRREGDLAAREQAVAALEQELLVLVPGKHSAALFVDYLARAEEATGVHIQGLTAEKAEVKEGVVEVALDLTATGTFTHHVLFQQELDQVPLFFRVDGWELAHDKESVFTRAQEKLEQVGPWAAEALLREPPQLAGRYRLMVYFRPQQPGPAGGEAAGAGGSRLDPFTSDLVGEFADELRKAYGEAGVPGFTPSPAEEEEPAQLG